MQNQSTARYRGFVNIELEARRQLEKVLDNCKGKPVPLNTELRQEVIRQLRHLAQRIILHALEGRTEPTEKHFGYEWEAALHRMEINPGRSEAARYLLEQTPTIDQKLQETAIQKRLALEWVYQQTAERIRQFTPYFSREDRELENWREQCPEAYRVCVGWWPRVKPQRMRRGEMSIWNRSGN